MAQMSEQHYYFYVLYCADHTLYGGYSTDVWRRFAMHQSGRGAKYTRGRGPLELVYTEICPNHSQALKRELEVKAMTRGEKEALIAGDLTSPNEEQAEKEKEAME